MRRQPADEGLQRLRQETPDAHEETSTLSEKTLAPEAFSLNHNGALILPLVTDSNKFIWVHSDQIDLQMDGAAELNKAFDQFPYLTHNQTVALAQRCSLHPDQVKVWFMMQRLRYGISWDYKDIIKVQREFKLSPGKKGLQNDRKKNNEWRRDINESNGKKTVEFSEKMAAIEGRMRIENMRANEQKKIKALIKEEKDRPVEEIESNEGNTQKKQEIMKVTYKKGNGRKVDDVDRAGMEEITNDEEEEKESTRFKATIQEWAAPKSFFVPDKGLDVYPPLSQTQASYMPPLTENQTPNYGMTAREGRRERELHAESTKPSVAGTGGKLKELMEVTRNAVVDSCTQFYYNTKKEEQMVMMRAAFLHSQYPDKRAYDHLVKQIGIPRNQLVQWFNDMRYYIKKAKPRWMSKEQHSQVLANVKFQQWRNAQPMSQAGESSGKTIWKMELERYESCAEEGMQE